MSTAIIDYGAGNLRSVEKALLSLGETPVITGVPEEILSADRIILPGVGAFGGRHGTPAAERTGSGDPAGSRGKHSFSGHLSGAAAFI